MVTCCFFLFFLQKQSMKNKNKKTNIYNLVNNTPALISHEYFHKLSGLIETDSQR